MQFESIRLSRASNTNPPPAVKAGKLMTSCFCPTNFAMKINREIYEMIESSECFLYDIVIARGLQTPQAWLARNSLS